MWTPLAPHRGLYSLAHLRTICGFSEPPTLFQKRKTNRKQVKRSGNSEAGTPFKCQCSSTSTYFQNKFPFTFDSSTLNPEMKIDQNFIKSEQHRQTMDLLKQMTLKSQNENQNYLELKTISHPDLVPSSIYSFSLFCTSPIDNDQKLSSSISYKPRTTITSRTESTPKTTLSIVHLLNSNNKVVLNEKSFVDKNMEIKRVQLPEEQTKPQCVKNQQKFPSYSTLPAKVENIAEKIFPENASSKGVASSILLHSTQFDGNRNESRESPPAEHLCPTTPEITLSDFSLPPFVGSPLERSPPTEPRTDPLKSLHPQSRPSYRHHGPSSSLSSFASFSSFTSLPPSSPLRSSPPSSPSPPTLILSPASSLCFSPSSVHTKSSSVEHSPILSPLLKQRMAATSPLAQTSTLNEMSGKSKEISKGKLPTEQNDENRSKCTFESGLIHPQKSILSTNTTAKKAESAINSKEKQQNTDDSAPFEEEKCAPRIFQWPTFDDDEEEEDDIEENAVTAKKEKNEGNLLNRQLIGEASIGIETKDESVDQNTNAAGAEEFPAIELDGSKISLADDCFCHPFSSFIKADATLSDLLAALEELKAIDNEKEEVENEKLFWSGIANEIRVTKDKISGDVFGAPIDQLVWKPSSEFGRVMTETPVGEGKTSVSSDERGGMEQNVEEQKSNIPSLSSKFGSTKRDSKISERKASQLRCKSDEKSQLINGKKIKRSESPDLRQEENIFKAKEGNEKFIKGVMKSNDKKEEKEGGNENGENVEINQSINSSKGKDSTKQTEKESLQLHQVEVLGEGIIRRAVTPPPPSDSYFLPTLFEPTAYTSSTDLTGVTALSEAPSACSSFPKYSSVIPQKSEFRRVKGFASIFGGEEENDNVFREDDGDNKEHSGANRKDNARLYAVDTFGRVGFDSVFPTNPKYSTYQHKDNAPIMTFQSSFHEIPEKLLQSRSDNYHQNPAETITKRKKAKFAPFLKKYIFKTDRPVFNETAYPLPSLINEWLTLRAEEVCDEEWLKNETDESENDSDEENQCAKEDEIEPSTSE
ncbi:uncharacterized protein MONOS_2355 [Monocercomonoides exilis]|uniref:uncharacterized protein n=1 Tax=Monocercomonoides exilis TaxID=2049356 RepID=UPI00355AAE08|nr:hypothetical protein MONOS_2355 [Monocercomonoides exilis]|eukprot:MONOS_2355.1-p1 / transcript=MONOS_2355.1 / gene=MONOS_2355 / organism=Monocercomonoides_exilis_PA203 / gene_product=unspecified product / transcript_product=unspecified product / location=Mono_scaffold00048:71761-74886(-) / protein_length=1042 / sequence_SO=supercontig / SO=protein_coding / is_pseudo=false